MTVADKIVNDLSQDDWKEGIAVSVRQLIELTRSSEQAVSAFTDVIARDAALASKILEAANSDCFKHRVREPVTTVTTAVLLMGLDTTRQLAMALSLMDKLFEPEQRALLHGEMASAVLACSLASKLMDEVGAADRDVPEVATLIKGLGRLVTAAYAYSEYQEVVVKTRGESPEDDAEMAVLGATFEDLAIRTAAQLALPVRYNFALNQPLAARVALLATDLAQALANRGLNFNDTTIANSLEGIVESFGLTRSKAVAMTEAAMREFEGVKAALKERADKDVRAARFQLNKPCRRAKPVDLKASQVALFAGMDMAALASKGAAPRNVAQKGVELVHAIGGFRNVLYCEKIGFDSFQARAGAGMCEAFKTRMWVVDVGAPRDLFGMALQKGVSVHLSNAQDPRFAGKLPDWVKQSFGAPGSLLLVPLGVGTSASGFLYCDKTGADMDVPEDVQYAIRSVKESIALALRGGQRTVP